MSEFAHIQPGHIQPGLAETERKILEGQQRVVNDELNRILGLSADQRAVIQIFENAGTTEPRINYWPGPGEEEWTFQVGNRVIRTPDPDIAAAAIGAVSSREEV